MKRIPSPFVDLALAALVVAAARLRGRQLGQAATAGHVTACGRMSSASTRLFRGYWTVLNAISAKKDATWAAGRRGVHTVGGRSNAAARVSGHRPRPISSSQRTTVWSAAWGTWGRR